MVAAGARAALVYVIQMDAERFDVARDIDPAYDKAFRHALAAGVESYAYVCRITPAGGRHRPAGGDRDAAMTAGQGRSKTRFILVSSICR